MVTGPPSFIQKCDTSHELATMQGAVTARTHQSVYIPHMYTYMHIYIYTYNATCKYARVCVYINLFADKCLFGGLRRCNDCAPGSVLAGLLVCAQDATLHKHSLGLGFRAAPPTLNSVPAPPATNLLYMGAYIHYVYGQRVVGGGGGGVGEVNSKA